MVNLDDVPPLPGHDLDRDCARGGAHLAHEPRRHASKASHQQVISDPFSPTGATTPQISPLPSARNQRVGEPRTGGRYRDTRQKWGNSMSTPGEFRRAPSY